MTPDVDKGLGEFARRLMEDLAPIVSPSFVSNELLSIGAMLAMAAEEWDRAAFRLVEENRAIRTLFGQLLPLVDDDAMKAHIASTDDDIHVSALRKTNEAMRDTLTRVHAVVELIDSDAGRAADAAIWAELAEGWRRRRTEVDYY